MLQFMGLQRVGHDWATELNTTNINNGSALQVDEVLGRSTKYWELLANFETCFP